jgi:hypothetical protein
MAPTTGSSLTVDSLRTCPTDEVDSRSSRPADDVTSTAVLTLETINVKFNLNCAAFPSWTSVKVCV